MSPMMGDLDDISSFGRRCGGRKRGIQWLTYISWVAVLGFLIQEKFKYNNINEFDFLLLIYMKYTKLFSRG